MKGDDQQAYSIYELITNTSADRPYAFRSLEQAKSETAAWQARNPGLQAMRNASSEVLLAFLRNYKEWRGASDRGDNFRLGAAMGDALRICIETAPKPLPGDLVLQLLRSYGSGLSWMLFGFPLGPLHGFGIARRIEQVSEDVLTLNEGTVYTSLLRLQQQGWIESEWGTSENNRRARFHSITRRGRTQLAVETENWERISGVIGRVLRANGRTDDLTKAPSPEIYLPLWQAQAFWAFSDGKGWERSGMWFSGRVCDAAGNQLELAGMEARDEAASAAFKVRLWHPLASDAAEVEHWRERIFSAAIRQPFRQAFREFYEVSEDERQTRMYSNRFAGIYLRQHQLASLCRARGWEYRLMGTDFDGHNVPTRNLPQWNMQAQVHVDLPPDRNAALRNSGLGERSGFGINLFVESDQVRFYRDRHEIAVDEVPAMLYSEMMRDVDLFTSVCAIGEDENWRDEGDRTLGVSSERITSQELSAAISLRSDILTRVLPLTPIADRCQLEASHLEVQGRLGRYRISLALGLAALVTDSGMRWIKISQKLLAAVPLEPDDVPIELDYRTEMILRKAYLLADDWKIEDSELIRQFMPK